MEVQVKHIEKQYWSGTPRYPNCEDSLGVLLSRSGRIHTGLIKKDEERLGKILREDLSPNSKFWETFRVKIGAEDISLNLDDPYDELKYLFLKGHKRVAASIDDRKPTANYYISNKEAEADKHNVYNKTKRKAYVEFDKMKDIDIRKALRLYGYKSDDISAPVAEERLMTLLEANPEQFFVKWVNNEHRATEFLIKEAQAKNVVRRNKSIYSYGTTTLGRSIDEAISFIDEKENSDIKVAIINETDAK